MVRNELPSSDAREPWEMTRDRPTILSQLRVLADLYLLLFSLAGEGFQARAMPQDRFVSTVDSNTPQEAEDRAA
jgi:hypothetical protein